jgi:foldase protein PrsA
MKSPISFFLFSLLVFAGLFYSQVTLGKSKSDSPGITDKNIVAIVNGKEIVKQDLYDLLVRTYGEDALDVLVRRTLIYQAAEKEGISVSKEETEDKLKALVKGEVDVMMQAYKISDKAELEKELAKIDSSIAEFEGKLNKRMRKQAEVEALAEKVMLKSIVVTEEDLKAAFEQEYGDRIEASQIVLKTRKDAEEVLKKLKSGADFTTIAKNESVDRASAARGGKMQPFSPKDSLGKDVANLKVGELSDIIKTDYGYHIIKITGKKSAGNKTIKSVKDDLEKIVIKKRYRERLGPWLISLIENASITKNLTFD